MTAIIVKYLWFDAYNEVAGQDFIKTNVPRVITLIGSPAYENTGTMVLGTAEGGYKVTLYMVNNLDDATLKDYGGDVLLTEMNDSLRSCGINHLNEHFAKEVMTGGKMQLKSKTLRLRFRKF